MSVEVATVDGMLDRLYKKYSRRRRRAKKAKKRPPVNLQNLVLIITVVVFVIVVLMWSLLWVFTCKRKKPHTNRFDDTSSVKQRPLFLVRRESNSGVYFAGMFRVANVEFVPEYRNADSSEFVSMANQIQHVVSAQWLRIHDDAELLLIHFP